MKPTWFFGIFFILELNSVISLSSSHTDLTSYPPDFWPIRAIEKIKENKFLFSLLTGKSIDDDKIVCLACDIVAALIVEEHTLGMTNIQLASEVEYFCEILKIEDSAVCEGVIEANVDVFVYILENSAVQSNDFCNLLLDCPQKNNTLDWTIDIPDGTTVEKIEPTGDKTIKIGQITDIHYDPNYTENITIECGEPSCCQSDQEPAKSPQDACGYWGSYKTADSPYRLVENALDQLASQQPDFVYFTGDLVSHRVWGTSHDFNSKIVSDIMDLFAKKLKVPVYPILGNHEGHPVNVYAPLEIQDEDISASWLYNLIVDKWTGLIKDDTVKATLLKGGYYTVTPKSGFRIIVLNNNVCSRENWWNLYSNKDPYGQLQWLIETLQEAENKKEIVHILYHIHTSSCLLSWGRAYNQILNRFSNTIAAQFNGHTHRDQFFVHYNTESKPIGVTFNGGSLMADYAAPNFKIYTIDDVTYDVLNAESYTFDLDEANKNKKIDWSKLYSFTESFGVKNLIAKELDSFLFSNFKTNATAGQLYHNYYYRNSARGKENCDDNCRHGYLCEIVTTVHGQNQKCDV